MAKSLLSFSFHISWESKNRTHQAELEQTQGDSEGQGSLACCGPWDHTVGHSLVTEQQRKFHMLYHR